MKHVLFALAFVLFASVVSAQSIPPAPRQLAFEHDGLNTDGYRIVIDKVASDLGMLPVTTTCPSCVATSRVFTIPALTPGVHTLWVVAYKNNFGDSAPSNTLTLTVLVISTPSGLRLVDAVTGADLGWLS